MSTSRSLHTNFLYLLAGLFLASCGAMQETAYVPDDVYYDKEKTYVREVVAETKEVQSEDEDEDEYYDPQEARSLSQRSYYDVTYRDPHYYNYGRFGFNSASWGMSMGNQMGPGYNGYYNSGSYWGGGSSFYGYDPFASNSMYYNNPWASPYNNGAWGNSYYGGYSSNWMYGGSYYGGGYNPYYGAYYDPYYGYYGYGGYCPSHFSPSSGYGYAGYYGPRASMNDVNNSSVATPRLGRRGSIDLMPPDPQRIDLSRSRTDVTSRERTRMNIPQEVSDRNDTRGERLNPPANNSRKERGSRSSDGNYKPSRSGGTSGGSTKGSGSSGNRGGRKPR